MGKLTRTTLAIEKDLLEKFDGWMAAHGYTNRSEAMRDLIRGALIEQEWANDNARVIAVLSIVYEHGARTLSRALTQLQHEDHHAILCSQHVHLDHHQCLEAILMQGTSRQLRNLADAIVRTRGVKAGKLSLMSKNV